MVSVCYLSPSFLGKNSAFGVAVLLLVFLSSSLTCNSLETASRSILHRWNSNNVAPSVLTRPTPASASSRTRIVATTTTTSAASRSPLFVAWASSTASDSVMSNQDDDDKAEVWTKPRLHNTATFRSIALLVALAAAGIVSNPTIPTATTAAAATTTAGSLMSNQMGATIHMLSFGTWFGTVAYTTFVAGITMFKNLPRQTFGKLQAKLFPKYFALCSATIVLQIVTLGHLTRISPKSVQALGVSLVMTLLNQFYLEPKSTSNMMERYRMEDTGQRDTPEYKQLKASFGKFHGMSSLTNLIALCSGSAHAYFLASALIVP